MWIFIGWGLCYTQSPKNWKEATKASKLQHDIAGTAARIKRLPMAKKGCGQLNSDDTYFADIWFSGVETAEEAMAEGVDY